MKVTTIVAVVGFGVWFYAMLRMAVATSLVTKLRRKGLIPENSLEVQRAIQKGEYDHIPEIRVRRASFRNFSRAYLLFFVLALVAVGLRSVL